MKRGEELKSGFKKTTLTPIKGKKSVKITSLIKTEAAPEDIYTVSTRYWQPLFDKISAKVLRAAVSAIAPSLTEIFNMSIDFKQELFLCLRMANGLC